MPIINDDSSDVIIGETASKSRTTAAHLEDLTRRLLVAHTSGNVDSLTDLLSTDFEMIDNSLHNCPVPQSRNREQHIKQVLAFK